ncbi:WD repeat containing protein 63 [Paragonimus skrjabini miyazakii]|uniref:WD repeat containing protein 63 n=1 Tax=Paragonimus skrjabini miyazakii TaxID=59628 RepID=A0A8S9Y824_9TREM|nr:WD repeat containing protein 63 [Paragonimus skrjabini miyazakii]
MTEESNDLPDENSKHSAKLPSGKRSSRIRNVETPKLRMTMSTGHESHETQDQLKSDIANIFASDVLPEGCVPIFLSKPTQQIFNIVADEQITQSKPTALVQKTDLLKDIQLRAAVSDFSVQKTAINDYPGTEILIMYDAEYKFGENYILVLSENSKQAILNPAEEKSEEQTEVEDEEEDEDTIEEESDSVTVFRPPVRRPWINLGSDKEVMELSDEFHIFCGPDSPLQDLGKYFPLFEQGLLENMMYDFLTNDFENLAVGDETYDTRADNTFKEFLSFTDLKFSKDKAVTCIQWHPTIKGIVAMSVGERHNYDQRCDQSSRVLLTPTHIILWSFADPIQPQLLLEAPEDIMCFQFNPTDPHIVAGGCFNGTVVLWDIERHLEDLRTVKARMKAKNKTPLFSFDDTDPNRVPISPYCCVSNIEASHTSAILDLIWMPDHVEVNRLGYCLENTSLKCVQLITCGLNNELLFWDIRPDRSPLAVDKNRDTIMPPRNVPQTFLALDMKWKPLFRVHLFKTEPGGDHAPTRFCMREVQGDRRLLAANADDRNTLGPKTSTIKTKPLQGASTMFYVGTEDGDLVYVDWMPQKDQDTGKMQTPKPDFYAPQHDGPISYLARSPFEPSVLLVVGGWTWSIWKEGVHSGPIIESGHAQKPFTGGSWSPTRPSVFFISRADGGLEVWDLLDKTHEPVMFQSVSANAVTKISLCNFSRRQIIAIGDVQGALQLFVVPRRLKTMLAEELNNFNAYIEREVKRREFVLMRWGLREQEKVEQEAENKRRAGVAPAVTLTEDEVLQKEALEYEDHLKSEQAFLRQLGMIEEEE